MKTGSHEISLERLNKTIRNVRDQKILKNSEPKLTRTVILRQLGEPSHLANLHPPDRNRDTDIVEAFLHLAIDANVTVTDDGPADFAPIQRNVAELESQLFGR